VKNARRQKATFLPDDLKITRAVWSRGEFSTKGSSKFTASTFSIRFIGGAKAEFGQADAL